MNNFFTKINFIFIALMFLVSCGHVEKYDVFDTKNIPKWSGRGSFPIYYENPNFQYKIVVELAFLSDAGDYPSEAHKIRRAKDFAQEYGGNAAIVYRSPIEPNKKDDFRTVKVIYIDRDVNKYVK